MSDDNNYLFWKWDSRQTGDRVKSQYREDTDLPRGSPPTLAAAGYIATMAYPDSFDERDQVVLALLAYLSKRTENPVNVDSPDEWRKLPSSLMNAWLRKAQDIIWLERFPATEAAYELQTEDGLGSDSDRVYAVCAKYAELEGRSTEEFVEREWEESKPVFHLVHAFVSSMVVNVMTAEAEESVNDWPLGRFVSRPDWLTRALPLSRNLMPALRRSKIVKKSEIILLR